MKKWIAPIVLTSLLGIWGGCNKDDASGGGKPAAAAAPAVAVVDFDKLLKQMGWTEEIKKNIEAADVQIRQQFRPIAQSVEDTLAQKRKDIAKAAGLNAAQTDNMNTAKDKADLEKLGLTSKQIDEFAQAAMSFQRDQNVLGQQFNQLKQQYQQQLLNAYRVSLDPAIRRVALANNRSLVLTPGGQVAWFDTSIDLTDKIVDDLQKSPPIKVALPDVPKVNFQAAPPTTGPTTSSK